MKNISSLLILGGALSVWSATGLAADPIDGLFNTGVDDAGVVRAHGARETHYRLIPPSPVTGQPYIYTSAGGFPVGPWLADNAGPSAWIVPTGAASANGDPVDFYYRLYVDLAGYDLASVAVNGQWSTDNLGTDILVNGQGTGNPNNAQYVAWTPFSLGAGFFSLGLNTLDFVLNNAPPGPNPTGIRIEISASGDRILPGTPPSIVTGPEDVTVKEGATVVLTVSATGSYPVTYQWSRNGTAIAGATKAWLELIDVRQSASGTYSVQVGSGGTTVSDSAVLAVIPTPVAVTRAPALFLGGIVGRSYDIDVTSALSASPTWELFQTVSPLTQTPFVIPIEASGTQRFFRGREQ